MSLMTYAENGLVQDEQDVNILLWNSLIEVPEEKYTSPLCYKKLMLDEGL